MSLPILEILSLKDSKLIRMALFFVIYITRNCHTYAQTSIQVCPVLRYLMDNLSVLQQHVLYIVLKKAIQITESCQYF